MEEWLRFAIGMIVLFLGIPIGNLLAKYTKEELKDGRKWFRRLVALSLLAAIVSLGFRNDILLFTFLFIAIVTSRSVKVRKKRK